MGPPPPVAWVPGARRPRDPVPLDVYGIVRGAHPAASASIARSRRVSGVEREGFQGFLSRARVGIHPSSDLSILSLSLRRHQEAQEAREEVDQGHGYQVPPQPEVLQEGQQARRG